MGLCTNLCANNMTTHTLAACNDFKLGDAPYVALIFCDEVYDDLKVDFTDNAAWITATADPNDAVIIQDVTVAMTSEINEIENPVANGETNISDGINYTLTVTDPNVSCDNNEFYAALNGRKAYVVIGFNDERMWVSEVMLNIYAKLPSIEKNAIQTYEFKAQKKFSKSKTWLCFDSQPALLSGK